MDALILVAARTFEGRPTAAIEVHGEPVARQLVAQLAPKQAVILAAPEHETVLAQVLPETRIIPVADVCEALEAIADLAASVTSLGLCQADVVAHDAALASVFEHPGASDLTLLGRLPDHAPGPLVRTSRGRVQAAGSGLHGVEGADRRGLGVLRLGPQGCASLQHGARELADLLRAQNSASPAGRPGLDLDEVVSLAQVVVVRRADTRLHAVEVRDFVWRRPASREEARQAEAALDAVDEDDLRLAAAVKANDGFFTTYFVSPYSRYLARWAARAGLTPNQVTAASFVVGVLAALAFATGTRAWAVTGALLLQAAFTLDCVDGQLARYSRNFSAFGAWLDSVFDRGKEYLVYAGLAVGAWRLGDDVWALAAAALALQTLRHHVDFAYAAQQTDDAGEQVRVPLLQPEDVSRTHWEAEPTAPRQAPVLGAAGRLLRVARSMERSSARWLKRILVLPIGERFALISLTAALFDPRTTFLALLVWGGGALAYTAGGRVLRSAL